MGIVFITLLAIHVIKTMIWKSRTEKEIDEFKNNNNFTTNETYDDYDITLSQALANSNIKNNGIDSPFYPKSDQIKTRKLVKTNPKK